MCSCGEVALQQVEEGQVGGSSSRDASCTPALKGLVDSSGCIDFICCKMPAGLGKQHLQCTGQATPHRVSKCVLRVSDRQAQCNSLGPDAHHTGWYGLHAHGVYHANGPP